MAPDIEELIKKVNALTLDKNRLRQKLTQLGQNGAGSASSNHQRDSSGISAAGSNHSSPALSASNSSTQLQGFTETTTKAPSSQGSKGSSSNTSNHHHHNNKTTSAATQQGGTNVSANIIAGVECSTSCEEDLLFMNDLYRKRLDEYNENWDFIQSKCTALLSELNAVQKHYALLKKEKLDVEEQLRAKCDECDKINSELQTVVLNYETQLSAMSEHLSMITSQVSLGDNLARVQPH